METFRAENVKADDKLSRNPGALCFTMNKSRTAFVLAMMKHHICVNPIRYTIQIIALLIFLALGLFGSFWTPFLIYIVMLILGKGALVVAHIYLYHSQRNGISFRLDKYGISLLVDSDTGKVRALTDKWTEVKNIFFHKGFVVMEMLPSAEMSSYILFDEGKAEQRSDILAFWHLALEGKAPQEQPDLYSAREIEDMEGFISSQFGEIETIGHEKQSDDLHIDLAYIPPTDARPYFTVATIGAGARRLDFTEEQRTEDQLTEYVEYVIHLPARWNCLGDDFAKEENWWPVRMLKGLARLSLENEYYHPWTDDIVDWEVQVPGVDVGGALYDYPLPDMTSRTVHTLPSGATVEFVQIIPLTHEEYEFCLEVDDNAERYPTLFGDAMEHIDEVPESERASLFGQAVVTHFEKLLNKKKESGDIIPLSTAS